MAQYHNNPIPKSIFITFTMPQKKHVVIGEQEAAKEQSDYNAQFKAELQAETKNTLGVGTPSPARHV